MLQLSFLGFKYARVIVSKDLSEPAIKEFKNKFSYVHLESFKRLDMAGFSEVNKKAVIINLAPDIEEIFNAFQDSTRNQIRRTYKIKNLRFVSLDKNFKTIDKLHRRFDIQRGWMPAPRAELEHSYIFSAYFKDKLISVVTCYNNNEVLRILELFSARYDEHKQYNGAVIGYATRRLVYEICKYGKEHGYTQFDLGGINFDDPAKAGVAEFKQSFNGAIVDVYFYIYITPAFKLLKKILKFFKLDISS